MPGVLQLQSLVEAGSWLLRISDDFSYSVVVLREVKSVKFGSLMQPGKALEVTVELTGRDGDRADLKGRGECEGIQTISAQFSLIRYNLKDRDPAFQERDERMISQWRNMRPLLMGELESRACS